MSDNKIGKVNDEEFSSFLNYLISVKGYSEKTKISYGEDIASFLLFLKEKQRDKGDIDIDLIREYLLTLNVNGLSKATVKRNVSSLKHFYTYLVTFKGYRDNPFEIVQTPKIDKKLPSFLSFEDMNELLESNKRRDDFFASRDQAILELLFASGIRLNELINIRINDIDFTNKRIKIKGKGNKERIVLFNESSLEAILNYMNNLRQRLIPNGVEQDILFLNKKGEKITERGVEHIITTCGVKSGFPLKLHPHMFRHSFATTLINNGADLRTIQELLGHSSIRTTSIYSHLSYNDLKRTYDRCLPSMNIDRYVIFDFNGTMFFDTEKHVIAWREFSLSHFNRKIDDEEFKFINGRNNKEILQYLSNEELDDEEVYKLSVEKEHIYQRICEEDKENLHLVDGLVEFLDRLKKNHIHLGIATSSLYPNVEWYIKTFNLLRWFEKKNIIYDDLTIKKGKPDPEIYFRAMKQLGAIKEQTLVFEDSIPGLESAKRAGVGMLVRIDNKAKSEVSLTDTIKDFSSLNENIINFLNLK